MQARKRCKSPVGRKSLFVGDVSGARKAGTAENQELQRPYVKKFLKTLEDSYPENTRISEAHPKTGVYVVDVYCFNPKANFIEIGNKVKKLFPNAECQAQTGTEYKWTLPYVQPSTPKQWGAIIFWSLFILFLVCWGIFGYQTLQ